METETRKGPTTEKISAIYRRIKKSHESGVKQRDEFQNNNNRQQAIMMAGKVKAYAEIMCLIHGKYPEHLEAGLWETGVK